MEQALGWEAAKALTNWNKQYYFRLRHHLSSIGSKLQAELEASSGLPAHVE